MKSLRINRRVFSKAFWDAIAPEGIAVSVVPFAMRWQEEKQHQSAEHPTGTVSDRDVAELTAIVAYFQPRIVAEVGTYIGRSTRAISRAIVGGGAVHTCDAMNSFTVSETYGADIVQYPKTTSTDMFMKLLDAQTKVEMFYIDGRLSDYDAGLMARINPRALIVLDDFEGVEKGVSNAALLLSSAYSGHLLIYPRDGGKTACLIPAADLQITAQ